MLNVAIKTSNQNLSVKKYNLKLELSLGHNSENGIFG